VAPDHARLGTDVAAVIREMQVSDASPLSVGPDAAGFFTAALAAELPRRVQVDALCVEGPFILFSTDLDVELGGTVYADDDLIAYDPRHGTFSMRFNGRLHGVPARADLDAATLDGIWGGDLLLSFNVDVELSGIGRVADHELALFDGAGFSGKAAVPHLPANRDLDAVSCSGGLLSFSLDGAAAFATATGDDEDVWQWDPAGTNVLRIAMTSVPKRSDLIALNEPQDPDEDGLTSFEEVSGVDDPATVWPDTGLTLGPAGRSSDPELADSDDDGIDDGEESACGTDPMDPDDVLAILAVTRGALNTTEVWWASVPGHHYAVEFAAAVTGTYSQVVVGGVSADPVTPVTSCTWSQPMGPGFYRIRLYTLR